LGTFLGTGPEVQRMGRHVAVIEVSLFVVDLSILDAELNMQLFSPQPFTGISPLFDLGFIESDPTATRISGPGDTFDMLLYSFTTGAVQVFSRFRRADKFTLSNAVFSSDGKWVLLSAKSPVVPGYAVGVVLVDFEKWKANPQPMA